VKKIFIDPGHGGKDPGASGNGLQEKDIVLDLSLELADRLKSYDCQVKLSRDKDVYVSLADRTNAANAWKADLFFSIHVNGHTNAGANGYEDFTYPIVDTATKDIRRAIHPHIAKVWTDAGRMNRGMKTANFQVLRETRMAAVLLENGFISNAKDAQLLQNSGFREKLAEAMAEGIASALKLERKETGPFPDVPADHWAADAIKFVSEQGVMSGFPDGAFRPDNAITRAQLAAVIEKIYKG